MTEEQKLTIESYNNSAKEFRNIIAQITNYDEAYTYFSEFIKDGDRVLDLACGPAQISKFILKSKDIKVTGVDLSTAMLEIAKQEIPNGTFAEHSIVDYCDGTEYDACVLGFGIPFLSSEETRECLKNVAINLKTDGYLYLSFMSTKNRTDENSEAEIVCMEKTSFGGDNLFEIHYHNREQIIKYLKKSGLYVEKEFSLPYKESDGRVTTDIIIIAKKDGLEAYKKKVENSIRKKFHKSIWCGFTKGVKEYSLVNDGDVICVCISGGKDSMLMAKLFQELKFHKKADFELKFLVMDPGYSKENRELIESNAKKLGIPITIFESDIFDSVFEIEQSPCYLCARMRRGHLYAKAKEMGCNKIALGHHYDDVIETILMGMLYGAQVQTMMPKLHSTNFEGMELIRPMYYVREEDIIKWVKYNDLHFLQCACKFTEESGYSYDNDAVTDKNSEEKSKRKEIKKLIAELKKINPFVETNIFNSVYNVNVDTVIEYKKNGVRHNFLDEY